MSNKKSRPTTKDKTSKRKPKAVEDNESLEFYIDNVFSSFRNLKKSVNDLPLDDYDYYHNTYDGFKGHMDSLGSRILGLAQKIVDNEIGRAHV